MLPILVAQKLAELQHFVPFSKEIVRDEKLHLHYFCIYCVQQLCNCGMFLHGKRHQNSVGEAIHKDL